MLYYTIAIPDGKCYTKIDYRCANYLLNIINVQDLFQVLTRCFQLVSTKEICDVLLKIYMVSIVHNELQCITVFYN